MSYYQERILVDFDETIFRFNAGFAAFCNEQRGTGLTETDFTSMHFDQIVGCSYDEAVGLIQDYHRSDYREIEPLPGAQAALGQLSLQADLYIVTARMREFEGSVADYCDRWFPGVFSDVIASGNKEDGGAYLAKAEIGDALNAGSIIDDSLGTVMDCARGRVMRGYLFGDRPWNQAPSQHLATRGVVRALDWQHNFAADRQSAAA